MEESALTLKSSDLDDYVKDKGFPVVYFYDPLCDHCEEESTPWFERLAQLSNGEFFLATVNARVEKGLKARFGMFGCPTIYIFMDGGKRVWEFKGPRATYRFLECVRRIRYTFPCQVSIDEPLPVDINETKIVGYFPKFDGEAYDCFLKVAGKFQSEFDFLAKVSSSSPVVSVYDNDNKVKGSFDKEFDVNVLVEFVENFTTPVMYEHDSRLAGKFFHSEVENDKAMLFLNDDDDSKNFKSEYWKFATRNQRKGININFMLGYIETSKNAFKYFQLHKRRGPFIVIKKLMGEIYAGKVEKYEPQLNLVEHVKKVIPHTFQKKVMDAGNVFLLLGPWCDCGHCKFVAETLNAVANEVKQNRTDIVIAKLPKTKDLCGDERWFLKLFEDTKKSGTNEI
ncbi:protein disulfide-isomerase-like [Rutidosis leptorrhynchoides]|uniref:protein disulfide-isomerase-like n=1 Tax=Rutidosis leptorrhynchoides TaxID=125765 RepID=UPI003A99E027